MENVRHVLYSALHTGNLKQKDQYDMFENPKSNFVFTQESMTV